ncbi:MAG TPA: SwmB domain-containing protein [Pseudonocardiaceae bacterium]|nr:SwmB domain-containing protein [Pseudonocardiaceae bacterium]
MKVRRKLGILVLAVVAAGTVATAGTASAAGNPARLRLTGQCGEFLDLTERTAGTLIVTLTVPSADPSEVWSLTASEQQYGAVTGARLGAPVTITPNPLPPLAFLPAEGGFSTTANFDDQPGLTHGFIYTATRTSPTPLTCSNEGFWTNPGNGGLPPAPQNPAGRPDSAPVLTGANEADSGTNVVAFQFDQEMLSTAQGVPATNRFAVTVDGVSRAVTGVSVVDDNPPNKAVVSLTLGGAALLPGGTVTVQYRQPLTASDPQLQDLESNLVASFAPFSVPVF